MELIELLNLPFDQYIMECYKLLNKNQDILGLDQASVTFMEAVWTRRYYLNKVGQYEID